MHKGNRLQVFPPYSSPFSGMQSRILRVGRGLNCAFTSIAGAIACSQPHDRVEVESGEYFETIAIGHPLELVGSKDDDRPTLVAQGLCVTINTDGPVLLDNIRILTRDAINSTCASILVVHGKPFIRNSEMTSMQVTNYCEPTVTGCHIVNSTGGIGLRIMDKAGGEYTHNLIAYHAEECIRVQTTGSPVFRNNKILQNEQRMLRSVVTFAGGGGASEGHTIFTDNIVSGTGVVAAEEGVEEALRMRAEDLRNEPDITSSESLIFVTNHAQPIFRGNFLCNGRHGFYFSRTEMPEENFRENRIAACRGWAIVVGRGTTITINRNDIQKCGGGVFVHHNWRPKRSRSAEAKRRAKRAAAVAAAAAAANGNGKGVEERQHVSDDDTGDSDGEDSMIMSPEAFRDLVREGIMAYREPDRDDTAPTAKKRRTKAPVCISGCTFRHNYQYAVYVEKSNVEMMENVFSENRVGLHMSTDCGKSSIYMNEFNFHVHAAIELIHYARVKLVDNRIQGGNVANTRVLLEGLQSHEIVDRKSQKVCAPPENTSMYGIYMENHSSAFLVTNTIGGSSINVFLSDCCHLKAEKNELRIAISHHFVAENFSQVRMLDNDIQEADRAAVVLSGNSSGVVHKNRFRANRKEALLVRRNAVGHITHNYFSSCHLGIRIASAAQCVVQNNQFMLSYSVITIQDEWSDLLVTDNRFFTTAASFVDASGRCSVVSRANRFEGSLGPAFQISDGAQVQVEKCGFFDCPGGFFRVYGLKETVQFFLKHCKLDFTKDHGIVALGSVMGSVTNVVMSRCQATAIFILCNTGFEIHDNRFEACVVGVSVAGSGKIFANVFEGWSEERNEYTVIGLHASGNSTADIHDNYLHDCHVGVLVEQNAAATCHNMTMHQCLDAGVVVWGHATDTVFYDLKITESDMVGVLLRNGADCTFRQCEITDSLHASIVSCGAGNAVIHHCKIQCDACELYVDATFRLPIEYGPVAFSFSEALCTNGGYREYVKKLRMSPCGEKMNFVRPKFILASNETPGAVSKADSQSLASPSPAHFYLTSGPSVSECTLGDCGTRQVLVSVRGFIFVDNCVIEARDAPLLGKKRRVVAADDGRAQTILPSSATMQAGVGMIILNEGGMEGHHLHLRSCPYAGIVAQRLGNVYLTESTIEGCGVGALFVSDENAPVEITGLNEQRRPVTAVGPGSVPGTGASANGRLGSGSPAAASTATAAPRRPFSGGAAARSRSPIQTTRAGGDDSNPLGPGEQDESRGGGRLSNPAIPEGSGRLCCCLESVVIRSMSYFGVQWCVNSAAELSRCSVEDAEIGLRVGDGVELRLSHVKVFKCRENGMELFGTPHPAPISIVQHVEIFECEGFGVVYRRLGVAGKKTNSRAQSPNRTMNNTFSGLFGGTMNMRQTLGSASGRRPGDDLAGNLSYNSGMYGGTVTAARYPDVLPDPSQAGGPMPFSSPSVVMTNGGGADSNESTSAVSPAPMGGGYGSMGSTMAPPHLDTRMSVASTITTATPPLCAMEEDAITPDEEEQPAPIPPLIDVLSSVFHFKNANIHDNALGEIYADDALCFVECTFSGAAPVGLCFCGREGQLYGYKCLFTRRKDVHIVMECTSRLRLLDCGLEKSTMGIVSLEASLVALQSCSFREMDVGLFCGASYFLPLPAGSAAVAAAMGAVGATASSPRGRASTVGRASVMDSTLMSGRPSKTSVSRCELVQNSFTNCADGLVCSDQYMSYLKEDIKKSAGASGLRLKNRGEAHNSARLRVRVFCNFFRDAAKCGCRLDAPWARSHFVRCEFNGCTTGVLATSHATDSRLVLRDCQYEMGSTGLELRQGADTLVTNCAFKQQGRAGVALFGGQKVDVCYNDFVEHAAPGGAILIDVSLQYHLHQLGTRTAVGRMDKQILHWRNSFHRSWVIRGNAFKKCASGIRMPSDRVPSFLLPVIQVYRNLFRDCGSAIQSSSTAVEPMAADERRDSPSAEVWKALTKDSSVYAVAVVQNRFDDNTVGIEVEGDTEMTIWNSQFFNSRKNAIRIEKQQKSELMLVDNIFQGHGRIARTVSEALFESAGGTGSMDNTAAVYISGSSGYICSNQFRENKVALYLEGVGRASELVVGGNLFQHNERSLRIHDKSITKVMHNTFLEGVYHDAHITPGASKNQVVIAYNRFLSSMIPCSVLYDRGATALLYRNLFTANANVAVHVMTRGDANIVECLFYAVGIAVQVDQEAALQLIADYFIQHAEAAVRVLQKSRVFAQRCAFVAYPDHRTFVLGPETKSMVDACLFLGAHRLIGSLECMLISSGAMKLTRCHFNGKQPGIIVDGVSKADIRYNELHGSDIGIEVRRGAVIDIEDNVFWLTRFGSISLQAGCEGMIKTNDMPDNSIVVAGDHDVQIVMPRAGLSESPFSSPGLSTISEVEQKIMKLYAMLLEEAPAAMPWKKQDGPSHVAIADEKLFFQQTAEASEYSVMERELSCIAMGLSKHSAVLLPAEDSGTHGDVAPAAPHAKAKKGSSAEMVEGGGEAEAEAEAESGFTGEEMVDEEQGESSSTSADSMPSLLEIPVDPNTATAEPSPTLRKKGGLLAQQNSSGEPEDPFRIILRQQNNPAYVGDAAVLSIEPREIIDPKDKKKRKGGAGKGLCARKPPKEKITADAEGLLQVADEVHRTECHPVVEQVRRQYKQYQQDPNHFLRVLPWTQQCQLSSGLEVFEPEAVESGNTEKRIDAAAERKERHRSSRRAGKTDSRSSSAPSSDNQLVSNLKNAQRDPQLALTARVPFVAPPTNLRRSMCTVSRGAAGLSGPASLSCQIDSLAKQLKAAADEAQLDTNGEPLVPTSATVGASPYGLGADGEGDEMAPLGIRTATDLVLARTEQAVAAVAAAAAYGPPTESSDPTSGRGVSTDSERTHSARRGVEASARKTKASPQQTSESKQLAKAPPPPHKPLKEKRRKKKKIFPILSVDLKTCPCQCTHETTPGKSVETYELEMQASKGIPVYRTDNLGFPSYKKAPLDFGNGTTVQLFLSDYRFCSLPLDDGARDDSLDDRPRQTYGSMSHGFDNLEPFCARHDSMAEALRRGSGGKSSSFSWAISGSAGPGTGKVPSSIFGGAVVVPPDALQAGQARTDPLDVVTTPVGTSGSDETDKRRPVDSRSKGILDPDLLNATPGTGTGGGSRHRDGRQSSSRNAGSSGGLPADHSPTPGSRGHSTAPPTPGAVLDMDELERGSDIQLFGHKKLDYERGEGGGPDSDGSEDAGHRRKRSSARGPHKRRSTAAGRRSSGDDDDDGGGGGGRRGRKKKGKGGKKRGGKRSAGSTKSSRSASSGRGADGRSSSSPSPFTGAAATESGAFIPPTDRGSTRNGRHSTTEDREGRATGKSSYSSAIAGRPAGRRGDGNSSGSDEEVETYEIDADGNRVRKVIKVKKDKKKHRRAAGEEDGEKRSEGRTGGRDGDRGEDGSRVRCRHGSPRDSSPHPSSSSRSGSPRSRSRGSPRGRSTTSSRAGSSSGRRSRKRGHRRPDGTWASGDDDEEEYEYITEPDGTVVRRKKGPLSVADGTAADGSDVDKEQAFDLIFDKNGICLGRRPKREDGEERSRTPSAAGPSSCSGTLDAETSSDRRKRLASLGDSKDAMFSSQLHLDEDDCPERIDTATRKDRRRMELWHKLCDILGRDPPVSKEHITSSERTDLSSGMNSSEMDASKSQSIRQYARSALIEQLQNLSMREARKSIGFLGVYRDIEDYEDVISIFAMLARRRARRLQRAKTDMYNLLRHDTSIFFFEDEQTAVQPLPLSPSELDEIAKEQSKAESGVHPAFWDEADKRRVLRDNPRPKDKRPVIPSRETYHCRPSAAELAARPSLRRGNGYIPEYQETLYSSAVDAKALSPVGSAAPGRPPGGGGTDQNAGAVQPGSPRGTPPSPSGRPRTQDAGERRTIYMVLPDPAKASSLSGFEAVQRPVVGEDEVYPDAIPFIAITVEEGVGVVDMQLTEILSSQLSDEAILRSRGRSYLTRAQNQKILEMYRISEATRARREAAARASAEAGMPLEPEADYRPNLFHTFLHSEGQGSSHSFGGRRGSAPFVSGQRPFSAQESDDTQRRTPNTALPQIPRSARSSEEGGFHYPGGARRSYQQQLPATAGYAAAVSGSRIYRSERPPPLDDTLALPASARRHKGNPLPLFPPPLSAPHQLHADGAAGPFRSGKAEGNRSSLIARGGLPPSMFDPARPAETTPFNAARRPITYDVLPRMKLPK